jgi:CRISPR-associated endonuclease/helicase Cas3
MRGLERDELLNDSVVGEFLRGEVGAAPCWLVCTPAGEVGINLSADLLVTELDTADHLIQRLGRLNRFGEGVGTAHVVCGEQTDDEKRAKPHEKRLARTLKYLKSLPVVNGGYDVSLGALQRQPPPEEACEPRPAMARLDRWLLDAWGLTSVMAREWPARPAVEVWLHGKQEEKSFPETQVAWREEVELLAQPDVSVEDIEEVLEKHSVLTHERLREPSIFIREKINALAVRHGMRRVIVIRPDGSIEKATLGELSEGRDDAKLRNSLLLLPPGVGRLAAGMMDTEEGDGATRYDVADLGVSRRARYRAVEEEGGWRFTQVGAEGSYLIEDPSFGAACRSMAEREGLQRVAVVDLTAEDEDEMAREEYFTLWKEQGPSQRSSDAVLLEKHTDGVTSMARALGERLLLSEEVIGALETAGRWHDAGKSRAIWQEAMGQREGEPVVGKPGARPVRPKLLGGYRHELGSLLDARQALSSAEAEVAELGLHLIGSHHGWARPHFPERAMDRENIGKSREEALEAARRYGRLQRRYGHWGLAYVEAVFKAADAMVSSQEREQPTHA